MAADFIGGSSEAMTPLQNFPQRRPTSRPDGQENVVEDRLLVVCIRRSGLDAGRLVSELRRIAISTGSACASGSGRPSHVLKAIGLSDAEARSSVRIGFGRYATASELGEAIDHIIEAAGRQQMTSA